MNHSSVTGVVARDLLTDQVFNQTRLVINYNWTADKVHV